jgi:hypothetical protein
MESGHGWHRGREGSVAPVVKFSYNTRIPVDGVPDNLVGTTRLAVGEQSFPAEITGGWVDSDGHLCMEMSVESEIVAGLIGES